MRLYFNGCSFTYGDELTDPKSQAWPALVASQLNAKFINDAVAGGSNDRIVYRTIKHLDKFDIAYIAWTNHARFTLHGHTNNEINFNPSFKITSRTNNEEFAIAEFAKLYYKYWHNELFSFKLWLQQIILLQTFLKSHNKKCIMINTFSNNLNKWLQPKEKFISAIKSLVCFDKMNDEQLMNEHYEITQLVTLIDTTNFIGWDTRWNLLEFQDPKKYSLGPNGHFLSKAHEDIAKIIANYDYN